MEGESKYSDIACVIFAGGKSSRMGTDKALLPFGGFDTLAEYQYRKFEPYFKNIFISCKNKEKFDFKANFIEDMTFYEEGEKEPTFSPAVALYSVFEKCDLKKIFAISVDTPFFDIKSFEKLKSADSEAYDMVVARNKNELQPLCSIYKNSCKDELLKMIKQNVHKLRLLIKNLNTNYVDFDDDKLFLNLNHPEDYEQALQNLQIKET